MPRVGVSLCRPFGGAAWGRAPALALLALAGCVHRSPEALARARLAHLATALEAADVNAIDDGVRPTPLASHAREAHARQVAPELARTATLLRSATNLDLRARVHLAGPLGTRVSLEHDPQGWRVDPDSVGLEVSTPRAAVELLAVALDRLESDPALALLTGALRNDVLRSARARADGLRELALRLPRIDARHAGWPLDLDYGDGLFVRLRAERGQWRVDDFN